MNLYLSMMVQGSSRENGVKSCLFPLARLGSDKLIMVNTGRSGYGKTVDVGVRRSVVPRYI